MGIKSLMWAKVVFQGKNLPSTVQENLLASDKAYLMTCFYPLVKSTCKTGKDR